MASMFGSYIKYKKFDIYYMFRQTIFMACGIIRAQGGIIMGKVSELCMNIFGTILIFFDIVPFLERDDISMIKL